MLSQKYLKYSSQFWNLFHTIVHYCKLNNTWDCDEHLFGQVSTPSGQNNYRDLFAQMCTCENMLAHYSDKLAHLQVVINYRDSIAQMCTREDMLARNLGALCLWCIPSPVFPGKSVHKHLFLFKAIPAGLRTFFTVKSCIWILNLWIINHWNLKLC